MTMIWQTDFKRLSVFCQQRFDDRAKDIESALDWCRNHSMLPLDDGSLAGFKNIGSIPVSTRSPEDRRKDVEECLNWPRAGKPDDHDMADDFKKIFSLLPTTKSRMPEDRARDIESALDWCRNNDISPGDDNFTDKCSKIGSIPCLEDLRKTERDVNDVLNWLRAGKPDDKHTPDGQFN